MRTNMRPTIGIIGGSGPLATLDIEKKILSANQKLTNPLVDQDYFNLVVFNYTGTYDRNDSVFFGKPAPLTQYIKYVESISALDVDLILLACNTAHMYLPTLRERTDIPIICMIDNTLEYLQRNFPENSKIGLISTKATQEKKLYHTSFSRNNVDIIDIDSSTQDSIMEAIYLIKAGVDPTCEDPFIENTYIPLEVSSEQVRNLKSHPYKHVLLQQRFPNPILTVKSAIEELKRKGCQHIILGCTELPLVIPYLGKEPNVHLIDPNTIIATAIVETLWQLENQTWPNIMIPVNDRKRV